MSSVSPLKSNAQELPVSASVIEQGQPRQATKVDAIQYTRAVAALLVVFYHQTVYLARIAGDSSLHDLVGGRPGLYGVMAFFVLSGYLMADIAPKYRPASFIVHRVIRIYPTYWLCVLLGTFFFSWLWFVTRPNADFVPNIQHMLFGNGVSRDLLRLTLAPVVFPDFPLGIEWTLLYETTFYVIIFAVSMTGQLRFLPHLAVAWLSLIVWTMWFHSAGEAGYTTPSIATLPFFGINAGFIFGVLSAKLRRRIPPALAIMAGLMLLALVEFFPTRLAMIQAAAGLAALIVGLMALERGGRLPRLPLLRRLGDWSYAMYLVHVPVILATGKLLGGSPTWLILTVGLFGVLLVSAVVGQLDLATYYRLKTVLDRAPSAVRTGLAVAFLTVFLAAALSGLGPR
jgi:exopolysaccharide production protein ExoZ